MSLTISSGVISAVADGMTFSGVTVLPGGELIVENGGVASDTVVSSGGLVEVYVGGNAVGTTFSGGHQFVFSGGTGTYNDPPTSFGVGHKESATSGTAVPFANVWEFVAGGSAVDVAVSNGTFLFAEASAVVTGTTVFSGGEALAQNGGGIVGTTVSDGGFSWAGVEGSTTGTKVSLGGAAGVGPGGVDSLTILFGDGNEFVYSGGSATSTTVSSGGRQYVESSGTATSTVVSSGGQQYVLSSGTATTTVVGSSGAQTISSGGTAVDTLVGSGGTEVVEGTASSTGVGSGGTQLIDPGGVASGTTIISGGTETISNGGFATEIALAIGAMIDLPGLPSSAGGSAVLNAGTLLTVTEGASVSSLILAGTYAKDVFQIFTDSSGGTLVTLAAAVSSSGGVTTVSSGGSTSKVAVSSGNALYASSGGQVVDTTVSGGFDEVIGGTAFATTVSSGGTEFTVSGGTANNTVVGKGGTEYVSSAGSIVSTMLVGGFDAVYGGSATSTTVASGGTEFVASGGVASGATVNSGGEEYVYGGGQTSNVVVLSGGAEAVSSGGLAIGTQLSGGSEIVYSGGTAVGTVIGSGGDEFVQSGGSAGDLLDSSTVVSSGGTEIVYSGGTIGATALTVGGTIDLPDLPFAAGGTATLNGLSDVLTVSEGGITSSLQLAGNYAGDTIRLAADPALLIRPGISVSGTRVTLGGPEPAPAALGSQGDAAPSAQAISFGSSVAVSSEADLVSAIIAFDRGGNDAAPDTIYTINFDNDIVLSAGELPTINLDSGDFLFINGGGHVLDGDAAQRGFFDYAGSVVINSLTIASAVASGGSGGGGGAGFGGGLYVAQGASVFLNDVTLAADSAVGGAGGSLAVGSAGTSLAVGGGGLGGNGEIGGGGIGDTATGGDGGPGGQGAAEEAAPGGGGVADAADGEDGTDGGGGGGDGGGGGGNGGGGDGGGDGDDGGGGGGNGGGGVDGPDAFVAGGVAIGAAGAAAATDAGGEGGFGGGGGGDMVTSGTGGNGGFGGGGGSDVVGSGGAGGFGGGGGNLASGGFGGGSGGVSGGGGGLGAGGGIFVQAGGTLVFVTGGLSGNTVTSGTGAPGAGSGEALGEGIFIQGDQAIALSPAAGQELVLSDGIADQAGDGGAGALAVFGGGTVVLAGDTRDTYTGGTYLNSGARLEIATGPSAGTGPVKFVSGSKDTLQIDGGGLVNPVQGFANGDTIVVGGLADLPGKAEKLNASKDVATGRLDIKAPDGSTVLGLDLVLGAQTLAAWDNGGGTLTITCFAAGTRIATARGEVSVERLHEGDLAISHVGAARPIRWIGHRHLDCRRHPRPRAVWPIRVWRDAFGYRLPVRDLRLSPDHAVFIYDALIPIRHLVNGTTIVQERAARVTYFHVELASHDVLLAEGLPVESYLDLNNRAAFENGGGAVMLHPEFARRTWEREACAPLVFGGPLLAAVKQRLALQAALLGHGLSHEIDPWLRVGRKIVRPERVGDAYRFALPSGTRMAWLLSGAHDAVVAELLLDRTAIGLFDARLGEGWEDADACGCRRTNGYARIAVGGARELIVRLNPSSRSNGVSEWIAPRGAAAG